MNCEQFEDHYELYAMGVAEDPERSEIRAHLDRGCEVCMAEMKRASELVTLMGSTAPPAEPSAQLRRRILASVGVERRRSAGTLLWAAAVAAALLAAAYFGVAQHRYAAEASRLRRDLRVQAADLTTLTEALAIIAGPGTTAVSFGDTQPKPPRGRVFVNPGQGVLLIASNLPLAPSGKLYEMWMLPKAGMPVPAGLFQSRQDGSALHIRGGAVDLAATGGVAVTLEDERGAGQPTTQPLIVAALK